MFITLEVANDFFMFLIPYLIFNFPSVSFSPPCTTLLWQKLAVELLVWGNISCWLDSNFIIWKWCNSYKFVTDFYLQFVFHSTAETVSGMTCKCSVEGYIILLLCFVKCKCYLKGFKLILCPNEHCIISGVLVFLYVDIYKTVVWASCEAWGYTGALWTNS